MVSNSIPTNKEIFQEKLNQSMEQISLSYFRKLLQPPQPSISIPMSHDIWDIRKSRKVELLFSLLQSVLFCCYNRTNTTEWVIYGGNTFIFPSSKDQEVQFSSVVICNGPSCCVTHRGRRKRAGKSWKPQSPAL
jgi:hypothetical protein